MGIEIRRFAWAHIEAIARLHRASEPVDHAGRVRDAAVLRARWRYPGCDPESECLVAEAEGTLTGYGMRSPVQSDGVCMVDGVVHPAWRRHGVGRQLLDRLAEDACREGARCVEVRARDDEPAVVGFCRALEFRVERTWYRMWLEPLRVPASAFPPGYSWRRYRPRWDDDTYVEIVNATLAQHWGTEPITAESLAHMVSQPAFDPANILFAAREREVVGVCTQRFIEREAAGRAFATTHIGPVGVLAAHRGLGLGHALMAAALRRAHRCGIQAAELDVDEGNGPAIHVYQDCGMDILFRILWYRRDVGSG